MDTNMNNRWGYWIVFSMRPLYMPSLINKKEGNDNKSYLINWDQKRRIHRFWSLDDGVKHHQDGKQQQSLLVMRGHYIFEWGKKSIFDHPTFVSVWFWPSNSKTGYLCHRTIKTVQIWPSGLFWWVILIFLFTIKSLDLKMIITFCPYLRFRSFSGHVFVMVSFIF